AMAWGLPIVMLNHQGVRAFVPDDVAMKASVDSPHNTIVELARGIETLAGDPHLRQQMGSAAIEVARLHSWDRKADQIAAWYEQILRSMPLEIPGASQPPVQA
ncbi:MAG: glycosyltransferase, partial [Tepidisphaeraceae bacterium]